MLEVAKTHLKAKQSRMVAKNSNMLARKLNVVNHKPEGKKNSTMLAQTSKMLQI